MSDLDITHLYFYANTFESMIFFKDSFVSLYFILSKIKNCVTPS